MDETVSAVLNGKTNLSRDEIWHLSGLVQDQYRESPNVVDIPDKNVIFVGDLHGELDCALSVKRYMEKYEKHHFVFLGDYADRGPNQIETFNLVMSLLLVSPSRVTMLRGNHESDDVAARYGFYNEVTRVYSFDLFKHYSRVFEILPIACYHEKSIFACHGGIPEGISTIEEIQSRNRRNPNFPDDVIFQIVWNDPQDNDFKFRPNMRSDRARTYGAEAFNRFMKDIDAKKMFRAHEVFPEGYRLFFNDRLISIFSATYGPRVRPKIVRLGSELSTELLSL
ncbi:MAG: serine/threonine protein phosphatase [Candidatus Thorarchaeota archaeon]|nr:serine/threonine protein phosphatase [Candidatus Thorarchaeota archaeon]